MIDGLKQGIVPIMKPRPGRAENSVARVGCKRFGPLGLRVKIF